MRILLIEDNEGLVRVLEQGLSEGGRRGGARGHRCGRPRAGAAGGLDAIVLDLGLPDMDGMDAAAGAPRRALHIPVLVLIGPRRGRVAGGGARRRRRRLPDQAVRVRRAAGAPAGA